MLKFQSTIGNSFWSSYVFSLDYYKKEKSVQSLSCVWFFATPWTAAHQAFLCIINSWSLLKLKSIKLVMHSNHIILCGPLLLLPSIFPCIRVFSKESVHIRWPKYWNFNFRISTSKEYSGLISFKIDWFDVISVQGTLMNLLQHYSSKAPIFWCSAFFIVQLSHPNMTMGKTIGFIRRAFVSKVIILLFDMLSRLVIAFLPRSKSLLISFLWSPSVVSDFGAQENKVCHCFHCLPIYLLWSNGMGCHDLCFWNVEF